LVISLSSDLHNHNHSTEHLTSFTSPAHLTRTPPPHPNTPLPLHTLHTPTSIPTSTPTHNMPSSRSTQSNSRSRVRTQNKAATGSDSSPHMARRGKGSANANRARREKAGTLKIDSAADEAAPISADQVDDHGEFEMTEGKLRKQAEQKWALRMNTIAPILGSGSDSENETDE